MKCPHCERFPTSVKQTTRPLDEGLDYGDVKRRLRKCRSCSRNFTTFEIHEDLFRKLAPTSKAKLKRSPLLGHGAKVTAPRTIPRKLTDGSK